MVFDINELVGQNREVSAFLPAVIYGYIYSTYSSLDVWAPKIGWIELEIFPLGPEWYAILTVLSIIICSQIYAITISETSSHKIYDEMPHIVELTLNLSMFIFAFLYVFSLITLVIRAGNGDIILNSLLLLLLITLMTTMWARLLSRYSDEVYGRGILE